MIKTTKISIRPNTNVPFFRHETSDNDYFIETYIETGMVTRAEITLSEDGLTEIIVNLYSSEEALTEVREDVIVIDGFVNKSHTYNAENGITSNVLVEEI